MIPGLPADKRDTHRYTPGMVKLTLLCLALLLSGCGGMNRAVGVLPNSLDDLAAKRAAARGEPAPAPGVPPAN